MIFWGWEWFEECWGDILGVGSGLRSVGVIFWGLGVV